MQSLPSFGQFLLCIWVAAGVFLASMTVINFPLTVITILSIIGGMILFSIHLHYQGEHKAHLWWFEDLAKARRLGTHPKPTSISQWFFEKFLDFEFWYFTSKKIALE